MPINQTDVAPLTEVERRMERRATNMDWQEFVAFMRPPKEQGDRLDVTSWPLTDATDEQVTLWIKEQFASLSTVYIGVQLAAVLARAQRAEAQLKAPANG